MNWIHPSRTDLATLSSALLKRWKGDRTQLQYSVDLGFKSNVATHWERGRKFPRASVAMRAAMQHDPSIGGFFTDFCNSDWLDRVPVDSRVGVGLLLNDLLGRRSVADLAEQLDVSRPTLYRWLNGKGEPLFPQLLACLAAVYMLSPFVQLIGCEEYEPPWLGPVEQDVEVALFLTMYRDLPQHDDRWLAERLILTTEELRRALSSLQQLGRVRFDGTHWTHLERDFNERHTPRSLDRGRALSQRAAGIVGSDAPRVGSSTTALVSEHEVDKITKILRQATQDVNRIALNSKGRDRMVRVTVLVNGLDGVSFKR